MNPQISVVKRFEKRPWLAALLAVFAVAGLAACGTAVKVYDGGDIEANRVEGGRAMAPVLLVYSVDFGNRDHQIFFWDQDKNRFNLNVPASVNPTKGVLFYLPADRIYALSGMLYLYNGYWRDLSFGKELPVFIAKSHRVTQISYFEVRSHPREGQFTMRTTRPEAQEIYLDNVREKFKWEAPLKSVQGVNMDNFRALHSAFE